MMLGSWLNLSGLTTALLLFLGGCLNTGCATLGTPALPSEYGRVTEELVKMVADQGVLDKFVGNMEGDFFDPGIAAFVETRVGVRFVGTQGEVDLSASGTGTQLPAGLRQSLIDQLSGPLSDEQRAAILDILGWNRVESPHNPVPDTD